MKFLKPLRDGKKYPIGANGAAVYDYQGNCLMPWSNGLNRNMVQCLYDFNIPLYLSHTVSKVVGKERVERIEISQVDAHMRAIPGTEQSFNVDTLILSIGLIPNNDLLNSISCSMSRTRGAIVNEHFETDIDGIFSCGNVLHVHASEEDLKMMVALLKPRYYIPVKGFYKDLLSNAEVALSMGINLNHNNVFLLENGLSAIFDASGAHIFDEKITHGDIMLVDCSLVARNGFTRCQGCFVDNKEIKAVVDDIKAQQTVVYDPNFLDLVDHEAEAKAAAAAAPQIDKAELKAKGDDDLYETIKTDIMSQEYTSISRIQRSYGVGFPRAGKIFARLQSEGVVALQPDTASSSKGCRVLLHDPTPAPVNAGSSDQTTLSLTPNVPGGSPKV